MPRVTQLSGVAFGLGQVWGALTPAESDGPVLCDGGGEWGTQMSEESHREQTWQRHSHQRGKQKQKNSQTLYVP